MEGQREGSEPVWERPWSLEEIRGGSESWSLAADAGLLNFLQEFSQQTISKTHEIEKQLDGLIRDTKTTNCRLHNVFNDFLMLSNTQFIENRVYDEEVPEPVPKPVGGEKPEQEKTREQKEAELIPKVQEAVNFGLQVLESAFEQLDIKAGNSDSEEEEVNERVEPILEPKDLYIDRPLPYIIGSQLFMEQEDVGLGDYSSEEGSIDSDRASGIDSEDEKDERESDDESENRSEEQRLQTALSDEDDDDDGSNLFDSEKEEDEENLEDAVKSEKRARPTSFADELAARIKVDVPNKANEDQASLPPAESRPKKQMKETRNVPSDDDDDDDLFKPPKLTDEDFSPFGTQGGLFSGGTGLFDDDEDDLFVDVPRSKKETEIKAPLNEEPSPSNPVKKVPVGGVSLFPGGDHVFNPSSVLVEKDKRKSLTPKSETPPKLPTGSGLFDDDEDDFFGKPNTKQMHPGNSAAELFVQEGEDELFNEKSDIPPLTQTNAVTEPEGAKETIVKKMISPESSNPLSQPPHNKHTKGLFSDEEDSEDLFSPSQNASKSKVPALPASKTAKALSLFDDEAEDNLFGVAAGKKTLTIKPPQEKIKAEEAAKTTPSTLFSSDEEDHWNRTKPIKPTSEQKQKEDIAKPGYPKDQSGKVAKRTSLFDDAEEDLFAITKDSQKNKQRTSLLFEDETSNEGSLFSALPVSTQSTLQTPEQEKMGQEPKKEDALVKRTEKKPAEVKTEVEKKSNETGEIDLFVEQKKEKVGPLITATQEDDEELFSGSPSMNKEKKSATKNVLSLFEEEEDDENVEDHLINRNVQEEIKKPFEKGSHPKSTGVFLDEELLFSHKLQKDNDPDVDLFASAKKTVSEKPGLAKLSSGAGLFGDDVEDDLFSSAKLKQPPKTPEKKIVAKKDISDTSKEISKHPKKKTDVKKERPFPELGSSEKPTGPVPIKTKEPTSRIGKLQANLSINPATMLPGAVFKAPGAKPSLPGLGVSSACLDGAPSVIVTSGKSSNEGIGVSFDSPAQMSTLHNANKDRIKVPGKRRPPSRAGRRLTSQDSGETEASNPLAVPHLSFSEESAPISVIKQTQTEQPKPGTKETERVERVPAAKPSSSASDLSVKKSKRTEKQETPVIPDLFDSDELFAKSAVSKRTTGTKPKAKSTDGFASKSAKEENKSALSVSDDQGSDDDLFRSAKQKAIKKTSSSSFLDDECEEDLFGGQKTVKKKDVPTALEQDRKPKTPNIFEDDIFANEAVKPTKKLKEKDKAEESSIFDDNTDIFADITVKPKEKKAKKKSEPKSIFDDDMDDIFSSGNQAKTSKSKVRIDRSPLEAKSESKGFSTFDDPLNALGGQ